MIFSIVSLTFRKANKQIADTRDTIYICVFVIVRIVFKLIILKNLYSVYFFFLKYLYRSLLCISYKSYSTFLSRDALLKMRYFIECDLLFNTHTHTRTHKWNLSNLSFSNNNIYSRYTYRPKQKINPQQNVMWENTAWRPQSLL